MQQTCTGTPNQPPQGEIGRCGIYYGFYSRQCCDPQFPSLTNCYKREAWIRPGYLGETLIQPFGKFPDILAEQICLLVGKPACLPPTEYTLLVVVPPAAAAATAAGVLLL